MLELEVALANILKAVPPPLSEVVALSEAPGRVLAERVLSKVDLPNFDNSSMDGYAVRADDVSSARPESPVPLRLAGRVAAGAAFDGELISGTCVRLFTGSPLPSGADAVVMQEDTSVEPAHPGEVLIRGAATPWENVRLRGTDIKRNAALLEAGSVLTAGRCGLLAATGCATITVGRRPVVGLLATGSELTEPDQPLSPGRIYESNRIALAALVRHTSGIPEIYPLVPDTLGETQRALANSLEKSDILVTSGGVSVGDLDFIKPALQEAGGKIAFWKVAIRPGRPFVFGRCGLKLIFGLPGNPVSAFVTFLLLVRPAILRFQGATDVRLPSHTGVLLEAISNPGDRRHFVRVIVDDVGQVTSAGVQASHTLSSLARANALLDLPPHSSLAAGAKVQVLRFG